MELIKLYTGPLEINTYLLISKNKALVIDPGGDEQKICDAAKSKNACIEKVLLTHGHFDHIGAVSALKKMGAQVYIGEGDAEMLKSNTENLGKYFGLPVETCSADVLLYGGEEILLGDERITVIATPGHSKGGMCYLTDLGVFTGDTLFCSSIGRTDFPHSNFDTLINSIKQKLFVLEKSTRVFPGHEIETTIENEIKFNPLVR